MYHIELHGNFLRLMPFRESRVSGAVPVESVRLPPMWPQFDSGPVWFEFDVGSRLAPRPFFRVLPLLKTQHPRIPFQPGQRTSMKLVSMWLPL